MAEVYVVSQWKGNTWEIGGIFTTEARARAACTKTTDGYWPVELDVDLGRATVFVPMRYPVMERVLGEQ